jgi:hypothetical protein
MHDKNYNNNIILLLINVDQNNNNIIILYNFIYFLKLNLPLVQI